MSTERDQLLAELAAARATVARLEAALDKVDLDRHDATNSGAANEGRHAPRPRKAAAREWPLDLREYMRYGRQMMLPQIGLGGQLKLKNAHVLVVGAGGLGCPVLLYLAAAGVGQITIMDHDTVELSNLHRQVLHTEDRVGMSKAESAKHALVALNSDVRVEAVQLAFTPAIFHPPTGHTPAELLEGEYTLILDCSDNPATRHFLNAYAAAHQIPLVSGGAVRAEGTVGVFNLPLIGPSASDDRGPCYACIFPPSGPPPSPPPPLLVSQLEALTDQERKERERLEDLYYERLSLSGTGACADEGVVGILCGVVGIGMASEAMRVLLGIATPTLHLYSPLSSSPYRTIKMRARKPTCPTCGGGGGEKTPTPSSTTISSSTASSRWQDFLARRDGTWPGWSDPLCETPGVGQRTCSSSAGRADSRIRVQDLHERLGSAPAKQSVRIVDTRPASEYGIANLEGSINIPFPRLLKDPSLALTAAAAAGGGSAATTDGNGPPPLPDRITFVCRRGNDSLLASRALRRYLEEHHSTTGHGDDESAEEIEGKTVEVDDLIGGLSAWAREGEEGFPVY